MTRLFHRASGVVLASFLLLASGADALAQSRAALLTEVSGTVSVTRGSGSNADATWGMQLFEGDVVTTGSNGTAAILFSDGNLVSLGGSADLTVSAAGGAGRAVASERVADVAELRLHRAGQGEIAALGGLRSGSKASEIVAITPRSSRVLERTPVLAWHASAEFDEYEVSVMDGTGTIWSQITTDTSVEYPDSAPSLEPGTEYLWRVKGVQMLDEVESEMVTFVVVDAETRAGIEAEAAEIAGQFADDADPSTRDYLLGSLYAREGVIGEAAQAFARIAERHPDSPAVHEILGRLYYEMGLKDEAIESLRMALDSER